MSGPTQALPVWLRALSRVCLCTYPRAFRREHSATYVEGVAHRWSRERANRGASGPFVLEHPPHRVQVGTGRFQHHGRGVPVGSGSELDRQHAFDRRAGPSAASYTLLVMPLVTVVIAAFVLGERISVQFVIGGAIILVGVYFGALRRVPGAKA